MTDQISDQQDMSPTTEQYMLLYKNATPTISHTYFSLETGLNA